MFHQRTKAVWMAVERYPNMSGAFDEARREIDQLRDLLDRAADVLAEAGAAMRARGAVLAEIRSEALPHRSADRRAKPSALASRRPICADRAGQTGLSRDFAGLCPRKTKREPRRGPFFGRKSRIPRDTNVRTSPVDGSADRYCRM